MKQLQTLSSFHQTHAKLDWRRENSLWNRISWLTPVLLSLGVRCACLQHVKTRAFFSQTDVIYQKLLEIKKKEIVCEVAWARDKHFLRKTAIAKHKSVQWMEKKTSFWLCFVISRFSDVRYMLITSSNLMHNLFFYFQYSLVLIWFLFMMGRRAVQPYVRSFAFGSWMTCCAILRDAEQREGNCLQRKACTYYQLQRCPAVGWPI